MKRIAFLALSALLSSCATFPIQPEMLIPGREDAIKTNVNLEYFNIALAYLDNKNYSKAEEYFEKAKSSKDLSEAAFYYIAVCNVYTGQWSKAHSAFKKMIAKDKENLNLKLSYAYINAMEGNLKTAEMMYRLLWKEASYDKSILQNLILVLIEEEKFDDAADNIKLMTEKFPEHEDTKSLEKALESKKEKSKKKNKVPEVKKADDSSEPQELTAEELFYSDDEKEKPEEK